MIGFFVLPEMGQTDNLSEQSLFSLKSICRNLGIHMKRCRIITQVSFSVGKNQFELVPSAASLMLRQECFGGMHNTLVLLQF